MLQVIVGFKKKKRVEFSLVMFSDYWETAQCVCVYIYI